MTLSLWRWLDGNGLVKECSLKGVRGEIDRRHLQWDAAWTPARRVGVQGDFEIENFTLQDLLVSVRQPGNFRPYTISVFHADLPLFRRNWLLYDILSANSIVGMFENCIFSCHRPQRQDFPAWNNQGQWYKMV